MKQLTAALIILPFLVTGISAHAANFNSHIKRIESKIQSSRLVQKNASKKLATNKHNSKKSRRYQSIIQKNKNKIRRYEVRIDHFLTAQAKKQGNATRKTAREAESVSKNGATMVGNVAKAAAAAEKPVVPESKPSFNAPNTSSSITLRWQAPAASVIGYYVYAGRSTDKTNQLVADLTRFNSRSPRFEIDTHRDVNASNTDKVCFRVKAYSNTTVSRFSDAVCANLES